MKKIIVACGGAVATSTIAAEEIKNLCADNGIESEIIQCRVSDIDSYIDADVVFICTTAKIDRTFGEIPLFRGLPLITGVGAEPLKKKMLAVLKK
ncbi:PTS galactitol transporter subunit IIB [Psychromonas sp.]|uniref:PTS galactitol transporter subunit IIB n=1 Tax=Psychromonas sp. TaxID=1884585 RepID=UPI003563D42E